MMYLLRGGGRDAGVWTSRQIQVTFGHQNEGSAACAGRDLLRMYAKEGSSFCSPSPPFRLQPVSSRGGQESAPPAISAPGSNLGLSRGSSAGEDLPSRQTAASHPLDVGSVPGRSRTLLP
eukprot:201720-Chlamydomonas_euryale.AAC.2